MSVLEIEGVTRTFGASANQVTALRGVDLAVDEGEVVGLLGVNGAGKTTLIKIVATLLLPTAGTVRICGVDAIRDPRSARRLFSLVLGGERGFYSRISGRENLIYFAVLAGLTRSAAIRAGDAALVRMGLADAADRRVETYSKGMRQRLHLAVGLITRPRLLLLDEPTVGLDPLEAARLRESITTLRGDGVAVLLTSHYLNDIEELASRVAVLRGGLITEDLPLSELLRRVGVVAQITVTGRGPCPSPGLAPPGVRVAEVDRYTEDGGWRMTLTLQDWSPESLRALAAVWPTGAVSDVTMAPASLEALFPGLVEAP